MKFWRVRPLITNQTTNFREPIEPGLGLAITLRFLATGYSYASLSLLFRVHRSTIGIIIDETCDAIIQEYMDEVIAMPKTPEGWKDIATGFSENWNFEHTVGAIDGSIFRSQSHLAPDPCTSITRASFPRSYWVWSTTTTNSSTPLSAPMVQHAMHSRVVRFLVDFRGRMPGVAL